MTSIGSHEPAAWWVTSISGSADHIASDGVNDGGEAGVGAPPSIGPTLSGRGEDASLTLDLRFSVQTDLQHLELSRERTKPSKHLGSPLTTQRLGAFGQSRLAHHGMENATIRP